jgi:hypothetical protein
MKEPQTEIIEHDGLSEPVSYHFSAISDNDSEVNLPMVSKRKLPRHDEYTPKKYDIRFQELIDR